MNLMSNKHIIRPLMVFKSEKSFWPQCGDLGYYGLYLAKNDQKCFRRSIGLLLYSNECIVLQKYN